MTYFIIYPQGDRSKLSVAELSDAMLYEKSDYAVASRKEFWDKDEAIEYTKQLAKENDLRYVGDSDGYLD